MKEFEIPRFEIVYFVKKDIITDSDCLPCSSCEEGQFDCRCLEFNTD